MAVLSCAVFCMCAKGNRVGAASCRSQRAECFGRGIGLELARKEGLDGEQQRDEDAEHRWTKYSLTLLDGQCCPGRWVVERAGAAIIPRLLQDAPSCSPRFPSPR